jgi:hypothetical protein
MPYSNPYTVRRRLIQVDFRQSAYLGHLLSTSLSTLPLLLSFVISVAADGHSSQVFLAFDHAIGRDLIDHLSSLATVALCTANPELTMTQIQAPSPVKTRLVPYLDSWFLFVFVNTHDTRIQTLDSE